MGREVKSQAMSTVVYYTLQVCKKKKKKQQINSVCLQSEVSRDFTASIIHRVVGCFWYVTFICVHRHAFFINSAHLSEQLTYMTGGQLVLSLLRAGQCRSSYVGVSNDISVLKSSCSAPQI